jgi:hypothetical protein
MDTKLAYGETPFITRPNASLIITGSSDCDYTNVQLPLRSVIEIQIHSHEVSVLSVSLNSQSDRMVYLPFVEPHEFRNKCLKMEYDFLRVC